MFESEVWGEHPGILLVGNVRISEWLCGSLSHDPSVDTVLKIFTSIKTFVSASVHEACYTLFHPPSVSAPPSFWYINVSSCLCSNNQEITSLLIGQREKIKMHSINSVLHLHFKICNSRLTPSIRCMLLIRCITRKIGCLFHKVKLSPTLDLSENVLLIFLFLKLAALWFLQTFWCSCLLCSCI